MLPFALHLLLHHLSFSSFFLLLHDCEESEQTLMNPTIYKLVAYYIAYTVHLNMLCLEGSHVLAIAWLRVLTIGIPVKIAFVHQQHRVVALLTQWLASGAVREDSVNTADLVSFINMNVCFDHKYSSYFTSNQADPRIEILYYSDR